MSEAELTKGSHLGLSRDDDDVAIHSSINDKSVSGFRFVAFVG